MTRAQFSGSVRDSAYTIGIGSQMSESGYVEVEGGQIFYKRDGEGPAVLLLHGGLLDHHMFDPQVQALSRNHTLVRMDLRGYGRSSVPGSAPYRHCDDVAAVADAVGLDRAVIGGESFGGAVTLDFAFAYPDRVAGLIFDSATPFAGWQWQGEFPGKEIFGAARAGGIPGVRQAMLDSELMASAMQHPEVAASLTDIVAGYSGWHMENRDPAQWAQDDAMGRLEEITAPALVVIGGHDALEFQRMGEVLADGLPNATRHFWPNSGHVPNMEEPDAFNQLVIDFLETVYPGPTS